MGGQVAKIGGQLKQAMGRLTDVWKRQEAERRKRILFGAIGIVVFAILLVIILGAVNGRYVVMYDTMTPDEITESIGILQTGGIPARRNAEGKLEVPSNQEPAAMAALALQNLPTTSLEDYSVIAQASGLTTTEAQQENYYWFQWQNRLQDALATLNGVRRAVVNINPGSKNEVVWDNQYEAPSAGVIITMQNNFVLTSERV
jgi:flagellar biosynthesis/type III secretory pathway M-ring protein FliF/YscJ